MQPTLVAFATRGGRGVRPYIAQLGLFNSQEFRHFVVQEPFSGTIGLQPMAIDYELWDSTLSGTADDFLGSARSNFNIDLFVRDVVLRQKTLGLAAIRAPEGGVDGKFHPRTFNHSDRSGLEGESLRPSPVPGVYVH